MPLRQAEPNRGVTVAAAVPAEAALSFLSCGTCGSLWLMTPKSLPLLSLPKGGIITAHLFLLFLFYFYVLLPQSPAIPPLPAPSLPCPSSWSTTSSISFTSLLLFLRLPSSSTSSPSTLLLFHWASMPLIALLLAANGQWSPWRWQKWRLT